MTKSTDELPMRPRTSRHLPRISASSSRATGTLACLIAILFTAACGARQPSSEPPAHSDPLAEVPAEELYQRGLVQAQSGDLTRAEQYIAAALSKGYEHREALPILLKICVASNRYRHALTYARPYLRQDPDNWSLRYLVATIHTAVGDLEMARDYLQEVLRAAPSEPGPHFLYAELMREENQETAVEHYRRYLSLAPTGPNAPSAERAIEQLTRPQEGSGPEHSGTSVQENSGIGNPDARNPASVNPDTENGSARGSGSERGGTAPRANETSAGSAAIPQRIPMPSSETP